ncbi:MAG: riboflavin synthase [candidate division Zixibacteria bacterium]|nr:riboflavin synthase [candidate division Zixibacteria bacterium]
MFTGIIETIGRVEGVVPVGNYYRLTIRPEAEFENLTIGESIAISGPCLTVMAFDKRSFTVEASQETLLLTTLKSLRSGGRVNLERALRADSRLGGHFVLGHIDGTSAVTGVQDIGRSLQVELELPKAFASLVVDKGSVALDGISLTISSVGKDRFTVNIIPETRRQTTWAGVKVGDLVNVEFDVLGKYLLRFLGTRGNGSTLTLDSLREMGY